MNIKLFFDGASKNNGSDNSLAGCGYFIRYDETSYGGYKFLRNATNNEAEYFGLINGLQTLINNQPDTLVVYGDSKLVIEQMKGAWKVKAPNLLPLWNEAQILAKKFKNIEFRHIDRSLNFEADRLANLAISSKSNKN